MGAITQTEWDRASPTSSCESSNANRKATRNDVKGVHVQKYQLPDALYFVLSTLAWIQCTGSSHMHIHTEKYVRTRHQKANQRHKGIATNGGDG